jgi:DNA invertase Pin-like site-specific DNA recombinase
MLDVRAAIYTRISRDPDSDSWSPDRQEILCRQLAQAKGYEIIDPPFTDRGFSAWNPKAKRPGWEALKESVRRGEVDVVMAYSLTRLGRRVAELLDLSDLLDTHNCDLVVVDMNMDTTSPGGKLIFTMIAALAQMESEQTSVRVKSAQKIKAERGRMHTGGKRQFGYGVEPTADTKEARQLAREAINREEAAVVRAVVSEIIGGKSLRQVAFDLNGAGLHTTAGNEWTGATVRQMVCSPRIAALRVYKGQTLQGDWEPIIDEERWLEVRTVIDARPGSHRGINTRRHLLSGLVQCGVCGVNMGAGAGDPPGRSSFKRYKCGKRPGSKACGGPSASRTSMDMFVTKKFFDFMAGARLRPVGQEGRSVAEIEADIVETEARLSRLARDHYIDGRLPENIFRSTNDELTESLAVLRRSRTTAVEEESLRKVALRPGNREDIEEWWESATLMERREALGRAIYKVVIHPAKVRGGNKFDTSRVEIQWRWDLYVRAGDAEWENMTDEEREQALIEAASEQVIVGAAT